MNTSRTLALCALTMLIAPLSWAGTVKCPASKDTWISTQGPEKDYNMGKSSRMKLKFIQEFGVMDFDVRALKGKKIKEAWLHVRFAGGKKWGLNGGTDLRTLVLSTIGHHWVEGRSPRYAKDAAGKGATFNESSYQTADWGWRGAKIYNVALGHGNTRVSTGELRPHQGRHRARIDTELVEALVAGTSHGLLIMDGVGDCFINSFIHTREAGGNGPYLMVVTGEADTRVPSAPAQVTARPAPQWATRKSGALWLKLRAPADAFGYHIKINGKAVERWQIPFAKSGKIQEFPIRDLPADMAVSVELTSVDGAGNTSRPVVVKARTSTELRVPGMPAFPFKPGVGAPKALGSARVWAFPEVSKVDPVSGKILHERSAGDFRKSNAVWNGASGTIRLAAAKGEIVSFQVAVEGNIRNVKMAVSDLRGPGEIPRTGVRLWRNWYVKNQSEYAIPLNGTFSCPMADNRVNGQKLQAVTVDYHVPLGTKPGAYSGKVTLSAGNALVKLPLKVKVYNATVPESIFFNPELNCYGGPGHAGSRQFKESFRLVHYHRCAINRVAHSHRGRTHEDLSPVADSQGHISDWSRFDNNVAGALDGSWFKDNPRSGVPVASFYLPFNEGWPLCYRKHYRAGCRTDSGNKEKMTRHHILAKPIEEGMSKAYQDAFVRCADEFYRHARERGWNRTIFQFYQNNKGWKGGYSLWTLDEPYKYADWAAINFWAGLFKKGINDPEVYTLKWHQDFFKKGGVQAMKRTRPTFTYRGDISRANYQGALSDGLMTQLYGHGPARMMRDMRRRGPMLLAAYGETNSWRSSNWGSAAWCLKSYVDYRDGVLPWQSLGGDGSLWSGDRGGNGNALVISTKAFGPAIASFRVHALRHGAQLCELLRVLQVKNNWSREHIGLLVNQRVPLGGEHRLANPDVCQAVKFNALTSQGFIELKEGILQLLEKSARPQSAWKTRPRNRGFGR